MKMLGEESWRFNIQGGDDLDFALYVRDALRLEVGTHRRVPPTQAQSVRDRSSLLPAGARDRAAAEWLEWWDERLAESARSFDPDYAPRRSIGPGIEFVLRRPVVQLWDDAAAWGESEEQIDPASLPWETMARVAEEVALDRSLRIGEVVADGIVLRAVGRWWYRLRPGVVVYTADAARDPTTAPIFVRAAFDPDMQVED